MNQITNTRKRIYRSYKGSNQILKRQRFSDQHARKVLNELPYPLTDFDVLQYLFNRPVASNECMALLNLCDYEINSISAWLDIPSDVIEGVIYGVEKLSIASREHLIRILDLYSLAEDALGSTRKLNLWLLRNHDVATSLPFYNLLNTIAGVRFVREQLFRSNPRLDKSWMKNNLGPYGTSKDPGLDVVTFRELTNIISMFYDEFEWYLEQFEDATDIVLPVHDDPNFKIKIRCFIRRDKQAGVRNEKDALFIRLVNEENQKMEEIMIRNFVGWPLRLKNAYDRLSFKLECLDRVKPLC